MDYQKVAHCLTFLSAFKAIPNWLLFSRANVRFAWNNEDQNNIQAMLEMIKIKTTIFVHVNKVSLKKHHKCPLLQIFD